MSVGMIGLGVVLLAGGIDLLIGLSQLRLMTQRSVH